MKTSHPIRIALLGAPAVALLVSQVSQATDLVPPPGYYTVIGERKGSAGSYPATPPPYTDSLVFTSKYEGSDSVRVTLNVKVEKIFRSQIKDIADMERGATKLVTRYMRSGRDGDLAYALNWMSVWACVGALQSGDFNHTGKSMRKWVLGSLSGAYMYLKFSSSRPLAAHAEQSREIRDWFARPGTQVVRDWSGLPLRKINNYFCWVAWPAISTAVMTNRRDLLSWAVSEFKVAANQVDEQGFLPNELKRRQCAFVYRNYALPSLAMIAAFTQVNGADPRQENHGILQCLAERVMKGVDDEKAFEEKTGEDQDMTDLKADNKHAWLESYCAFYRCEPKVLEVKKDREPSNSFRLGGEVTRMLSREGGGWGRGGKWAYRPGVTHSPAPFTDQASRRASHPDPYATGAGGHNTLGNITGGRMAGRPALP